VKGTKDTIGDSLAVLQSLTSTSRSTKNELKKAVGNIQQSLASKDINWINATHIASDHGNIVFDRGRDAMSSLAKISDPTQKDTYDATIAPMVKNLIAQIVSADRLLVTTLIGETTPTAKDDTNRIADANSKLSEGDALVVAVKPSDAINKYKEAWNKAGEVTYQNTGCSYNDLKWDGATGTCPKDNSVITLAAANVSGTSATSGSLGLIAIVIGIIAIIMAAASLTLVMNKKR
jgi:hypothetical protein